MQAAVAEAAARATREQAVTDARRDLQELRSRAVEAGRDRSRKIIKTSRIDPGTGEIRYNPAGRLLRDWYLHVYMNTVRTNLGEPAVAIDAQEIEDTAALLHRVSGHSPALDALQAVGVVRDVAVDDAAQAASKIVSNLEVAASRRAIAYVPDDRFAGDELAVHVTRHWFQRSYQDHLHGATRSRQPLTEVTDAETHQVALSLESGRALQLFDRGGRPLVTAHGTVATSIDRDLAAGTTGVVSAVIDSAHHTDPNQPLRLRVTRTWRDLDVHARAMWLRTAGSASGSAELPWPQLAGDEQTNLIRLYLQTHTPAQVGVPFEAERIEAEPRLAAMAMFAHVAPLDAVGSNLRSDPIESPSVSLAALDLARPQALGRSEAEPRVEKSGLG